MLGSAFAKATAGKPPRVKTAPAAFGSCPRRARARRRSRRAKARRPLPRSGPPRGGLSAERPKLSFIPLMPAPESLRTRLLALIDRFPQQRLVVFGDLIADEFVYGRVARVSREAPVLILEYDSTEIVPGGAGNAANNVAALGGDGDASASPAATRRDGGCSRRCGRAVDVRERSSPAASPRRPRRASSPAASTRQSSRSSAIDRAVARADREAVRAAIGRAAAAVLAAPTRCSCRTTAAAWSRRRSCAARSERCGTAARQPPVLVDSRYALLDYRGMTACTPNESEVEQLLGVRIGENTRVLERAGRALLDADAARRRAHHARQPRHGAVRAGSADRAHPDRRLRSDRRRHRRRRYRDRDDDAGAGGGRHVRSKPRASPTTPAASS